MSEADNLEYCGIGIRGVAMAVDSVVWFALFFVVVSAVGAFTGDLTTTESGVNTNLEGTPALVAFVLWLGVSMGYHAVLEWKYGKTLGKSLVKIRARSADGSPLTLRDSVVRNVLRLVDFLPVLYLVGIVLVALSNRKARLGDRVADTAVVRA